MQLVGFANVARREKVRMSERNMVVEEWPFRLRKEVGEVGAQRGFEMVETSWVEGCERFVEWVREE